MSQTCAHQDTSCTRSHAFSLPAACSFPGVLHHAWLPPQTPRLRAQDRHTQTPCALVSIARSPDKPKGLTGKEPCDHGVPLLRVTVNPPASGPWMSTIAAHVGFPSRRSNAARSKELQAARIHTCTYKHTSSRSHSRPMLGFPDCDQHAPGITHDYTFTYS